MDADIPPDAERDVPTTPHELLKKIADEVAFTVLEWRVYRKTFSIETVDLLQRSAAGFFEVVFFALQRDTILALARLFDPPAMRAFGNVSLPALAETLRGHTDPARLHDIEERVAALTSLAAPLLKLRNKLLAHNDEAHSLGRLQSIACSPDTVDRVLAGADEIVQAVAALISPHSIPCPMQTTHLNGADRLLRLLRVAVARDREHPAYE